MKRTYTVYAGQINQQAIQIEASSPQAAARKVQKELKKMYPEVYAVETVDKRTREYRTYTINRDFTL